MTSDSIQPGIAGGMPPVRSMNSEIRHLEQLAEGGAKSLEKVAAKFESIFLGMLLKQMWESVERAGLFEEGAGRQIHDGMMVDMLSDHLAQNGGIGMAKALVSRLQQAALAYERQMAGPALEDAAREKDTAALDSEDPKAPAGDAGGKH
jgi:flagellar protein FlgJ